jgi:hypothetical protein
MKLKVIVLVVVSIVIAVLLATALGSYTRVPDSALADIATPNANVGAGPSRPSTAGKNYLPIIFLNSATAGGAWLLGGNAGTNWTSDFLGTTDNMTLTFRVSNTVAYRIVPAANLVDGFVPNIIGGSPTNAVPSTALGATIAGGGSRLSPNVISGTGQFAFIGGGLGNTANQSLSSIGGGSGNRANGTWAFVGGGMNNTADAWATVGGGVYNSAGGLAFVGGGGNNTAIGEGSTIGGGDHNVGGGVHSSIGGGIQNTTSGTNATAAGGANNYAWGNSSAIGGGVYNSAIGYYGTVGGGNHNSANGQYATVPGGWQNVASGVQSFAAGSHAQALHTGAFVWGDSTNAAFASTANDQFLVRASGGIFLYTDSAATVGAALNPGSGSWSNMSNKNLKSNFADVDSRAILERVSELPISTWNYKTQDESIRHIGPMAQDFNAAFNVGENDTTISTVDAQGVAFAAIQGLNQVVREKEIRIAALEEKNEQELKELTELKSEVAALKAQGTATGAFAWRDVVAGAMIALVAVMWVRRRR